MIGRKRPRFEVGEKVLVRPKLFGTRSDRWVTGIVISSQGGRPIVQYRVEYDEGTRTEAQAFASRHVAKIP